jgi:hypothetical protein
MSSSTSEEAPAPTARSVVEAAHAAAITPYRELVLDRLRSQLADSPDFDGPQADAFLRVVAAVVWYAAYRIDHPAEFMRRVEPGENVVEQDLADDLHLWLQSGALTEGVVVYEPQRIGGGRADIVVAFTNQRVVNELKRELHDASREKLEAAYADQAATYDATDYPFGIAVVLDLTGPQTGAAPRLDECLWVHHHRGDESGGTGRWLVFCRIPGRRTTPSALTKTRKRKS